MQKKIIFEVPYSQVLQDLRIIFKEAEEMRKETRSAKEPPKLLTLSETADYFKVSKKTVYNWSRTKILQRIEVGNRVFFEWEQIKNLINKNKI